MKGLRCCTLLLLLTAAVQGGPAGAASAAGRSAAEWRAATAKELARVIPARAPVEQERIETETSSMTGIVDAHNRTIAAVVLITAGYAANGKYSHYLVAQAPLRLGSAIALPPGAYVMGWTRVPEGLAVHVYEAETGRERGMAVAAPIVEKVQVVPIKIWPPTTHAFIQIGRFMLPYTAGE